MVTANKSTTTSPMLRHAFESFEHGLLHYLEGTELGRKFALLHIDHAEVAPFVCTAARGF